MEMNTKQKLATEAAIKQKFSNEKRLTFKGFSKPNNNNIMVNAGCVLKPIE